MAAKEVEPSVALCGTIQLLHGTFRGYPQGKKEMAQYVLQIVEQWIQKNIVTVLTDKKLKRETRLRKAIASINQLYNGGAKNCLLRTLSIGADADAFKETVTRCFNLRWFC